jgi:hypothetical protein
MAMLPSAVYEDLRFKRASSAVQRLLASFKFRQLSLATAPRDSTVVAVQGRSKIRLYCLFRPHQRRERAIPSAVALGTGARLEPL